MGRLVSLTFSHCTLLSFSTLSLFLHKIFTSAKMLRNSANYSSADEHTALTPQQNGETLRREENPFKYAEEDSKPMWVFLIVVVVAFVGLMFLLCPASSSVDDTLARIEREAVQTRNDDPMNAAMAAY